MINNKGAKAPIPKKVMVARLKADRESQGIFKRSFWVTNKQHKQLKQIHEILTKGDEDDNTI